MRKSFRVATVFTGAAACAAAFTPAAALAATATTMAKTQQMGPDTFHINCPGGKTGAPTTSMHFYYAPSADHGPTCVGQLGHTSLGDTFYWSYCAGNNSGHLSTPNVVDIHFYRSHDYLLYGEVNNVTITGFAGGFKCPA